MTRERVLVVFFFCSDVALLALQRNTLTIFRNLMQWSTEYITGRMTAWIRQQGGWVSSNLFDYLNHRLKNYFSAGSSTQSISQHLYGAR